MAAHTSGKTKLPQPTTDDYNQYARNTLKNLVNVYEKIALRGPVLALVRPGSYSKLVITSDGGLQHSELKGTKVLCDPVLQRSFASGNVKSAALLRACLSPTLELKEVESGYMIGGRGSLLTCGDVELNPGPIASWLRGVIPVMYRKAADASLVQSVVTKTGSELFAVAAHRNAQVADGIWSVATRMKSHDMHKYGARYSKLSQAQSKASKRLAAASKNAESRAHTLQKAWKAAHNVKVGSARKGGLFALFGAGVALTSDTGDRVPVVVKPQVSCEPADQSASSVHPLVSVTTRARGVAATGSCINTTSGEAIFPAMEVLYAASELNTSNPEYWGRLYVRAFKYALVHFMSSHRLRYRKQGRGVVIGFVIPESSKTIPNADLVAVFVEYVETLRCCHDVASECGDWADPTNWKYDLKGITCAYVSDVLVHSLTRLQIHPSLLSNRLSAIYTECAEFVTTEDWTQELASITGHHHLSALCDPSICQYGGLCATLASTAAYRDEHEVSHLSKCIAHSRSVAAVRGKIVDPTAVSACGPYGTGGDGGAQTLAFQQTSRPVSYVAAVTGCPRSSSPDLVFDAGSEDVNRRAGGEGSRGSQLDSSDAKSSPVLSPDCGNAADACRPGVSVVKERTPGNGREPQAGPSGQSSGTSNDSMPRGGRILNRPAKELSVALVGDKPPALRVEQSLGVAGRKNDPHEIAIKVGPKTGDMRPGGPPRKGKGEDSGAGVGDGTVRPAEKADVDASVSGALLEPLGSRGLLPQPAQSSKGKGVGKSSSSVGASNNTADPYNASRSIEFTAVNCTFELGRVYIRVSSEQEEAIRDGALRVFVARFDPEGCNNQGVCKDGEVADIVETRGPKVNPVEGNGVSLTVLNDDKTAGTRPNARKRSRNKHANGGKGSQLGSKGQAPSQDVEVVRETSQHIVRSESVGHARTGPAAQASTGDIQQTCDLPAVARDVQQPTQERVLHKPGHTIPCRWRNHEWGYDDRAGELYCSTCHSYVLPGRYKKNCYHQRKQHARRVGGTALKYGNPRSGVDKDIARDKSPSSGRSIDTGVAKHIRRRRRSRDNMREGTHVDMRASPASVVDSYGSLSESGRYRGELREHRVLPAQTVEWRNQAYYGTQPSKSFAEVVYGNREVHQQPPVVPPYGVDGACYTPCRYPVVGPIFPEQRQAVGWGPPNGSYQFGVPAHQLVPTLPNEIPREWYVPAHAAEGGRDGQGTVLANVGHFANGAV